MRAFSKRVFTSGQVTKMVVPTFNPPYPKTHAAHKHHGSMFDRWELLPIKVHCVNRNFRPFLAPVTRPSYMNSIHRLRRFATCTNMNFLHQGCTYMQTRPKLYTTSLRGWSFNSVTILEGSRRSTKGFRGSAMAILFLQFAKLQISEEFCHRKRNDHAFKSWLYATAA